MNKKNENKPEKKETPSYDEGQVRDPAIKRMQGEESGNRVVQDWDGGKKKSGLTRNRFFKLLKKSVLRKID